MKLVFTLKSQGGSVKNEVATQSLSDLADRMGLEGGTAMMVVAILAWWMVALASPAGGVQVGRGTGSEAHLMVLPTGARR
ncbi:MAG: hypothetical protein ABI193_01010 [Minicystis sp.]